VNDFGEVGLDHDLIDTVDEEVALMKSGCLCCSIREDLARVLNSCHTYHIYHILVKL